VLTAHGPHPSTSCRIRRHPGGRQRLGGWTCWGGERRGIDVNGGRFFDIDWRPYPRRPRPPVLVPVLARIQTATVLERLRARAGRPSSALGVLRVVITVRIGLPASITRPLPRILVTLLTCGRLLMPFSLPGKKKPSKRRHTHTLFFSGSKACLLYAGGAPSSGTAVAPPPTAGGAGAWGLPGGRGLRAGRVVPAGGGRSGRSSDCLAPCVYEWAPSRHSACNVRRPVATCTTPSSPRDRSGVRTSAATAPAEPRLRSLHSSRSAGLPTRLTWRFRAGTYSGGFFDC